MLAPIHRCDDPSCPSYGQMTFKSCGCHKTGEQMLIDQRTVLLAACEALLAEYDNTYDGAPMSVDMLDAITDMRAVVRKTRAQP